MATENPSQSPHPETPTSVPEERRRRGHEHALTRVIDRIIKEHPSAGLKAQKEISMGLADVPAARKALRIYENFISYSLERRQVEKSGEQEFSPDPYLITELIVLWQDEDARKTFVEQYAQARSDQKEFNLADVGKKWKEVEHDIAVLEKHVQELTQALTLQTITKPTERRAAESRLAYGERTLAQLKSDRENITTLEGYEHSPENCGVAALIHYETLLRYRREIEEHHFAWLPSRVRNHQTIREVMQHTGKAPLLVGPPGTGKTTQIDAVSMELTGLPALRIECRSDLDEDGLIALRDFKAGEGAFDYTGRVAEAFTGYTHSQAQQPAYAHGRPVSLDELSQLNLDKLLAPIKNLRLAKPGRPLSRTVQHPVLPGSELFATSNLPIEDERLEREFARIPTDYFEMSEKNPELFDFLLAGLIKRAAEGHFSSTDRAKLEPKYEPLPVPSDKQTPLSDGRVIVETQELVKERNDPRHGFLYRFAHAIRAIQDAYIHGSKFNEKHLAHTAFYEDINPSTGKLDITKYISDMETPPPDSGLGGGEMLKLRRGASTLAPDVILTWMKGIASSGTSDLVSWLQRMLQEHIDQTSVEDGERIRLIADYFHFFDEAPSSATDQKPLTPKEIGYLSPRVPRPVRVEQSKGKSPTGSPPGKPAIGEEPSTKQYENHLVVLESGEEVLMRNTELTIGNGDDARVVAQGAIVRVLGQNYEFAGLVEDPSNVHHGKPIARVASDKELYIVLSVEELENGIFLYETQQLLNECGDIEKDFKQM
ncbi:AAA family ATPase [Candidatus Uhrbacteria bacterium]|nr:AAA family ATPase [Candidatus Uhrbacteria bacterium]